MPRRWDRCGRRRESAEHSPRAEEVDDRERPRAFLVNHGSFNPVHRGHIRMMQRARERLEQAGFAVDFGVLAITWAGHIRGKGDEPLPDDLRGRLIDRLIGDEGESVSWLRSDVRGVNFGSSGRMIGGLLLKEHPDMVGFSVCGADTAMRYRNSFRTNAVIVARAGCELVGEYAPGQVFCAAVEADEDDETLAYSSTAVRAAFAAGDDALVARMCGPAAAGELREEVRPRASS